MNVFSLPAITFWICCMCCLACGHNANAKQNTSNNTQITVTKETLYAQGMQFAQNGDFIRAEQYLNASIQAGYPEAQVLPMLLQVCIQSSKLRNALMHAEPYLAHHPNDWSLRLVVASVYHALGDSKHAEEHVKKAFRAAPKASQVNYLMALIARDNLGDMGQAAEHFGRYLEVEPEGEHAEEARAYLLDMASNAESSP